MDSVLLTRERICGLLPQRDTHAHKGSCGRLGVIAGSQDMLGAALLACKAALRSGAGLVYLMTVSDVVTDLVTKVPEVIVLSLPSQEGWLTEEALDVVKAYHEDYHFDALAIGPGLGRQESTQSLIRSFIPWIQTVGLPVVWDADALFACDGSDFQVLAMDQTVMTPHVKEFERLFKEPVSEDTRLQCVYDALQRSHQIVVLKGPGSLVGSSQGVDENTTGHEGLATAGSGDVLTGFISGFMAQGLSSLHAAQLGVFIHGYCAELVSQEVGIHGLVASDLIDVVGAAIKEVCEVSSL